MRKLVSIIVLALVAIIVFAACDPTANKQTLQRKSSIEKRAGSFDRAEKAYPLPDLSNYPLRKALVEMTKRQDLLNHPWYIYILADTGNIIGYYVANTVPVNACDFLSSTEDIRDDDDGNLILTAPSLDGIYYGGSGATSGCDAWFFFDAATNSLIQIRGVKFFSSDQPLKVNAQPIEVAR